MLVNESSQCPEKHWEEEFHMKLYAAVYGIIVIPGFLGNSVALWVLFGNIKREKKAVIFMTNLAIADLAHMLSLPLRIFYYTFHTWPFGKFMCLFCFYLKFLNMYASILFLVCISIQRCVFLICPFKYSSWRRRYDVGLCIIGWVFVILMCLPFPMMRNTDTFNSTLCFASLPMKHVNLGSSIAMLMAAELLGFVGPIIIIILCTWKTAQSLKKNRIVTNNQGGRRALKLVLMCAIVFLVCFAPYHIFFLLNQLTWLEVITDCTMQKNIRILHSVTLCLASMNACLDPCIYYFVTAEFREQLSRTSSFLVRSRHLSRDSTMSR
ncbi:probable G-protein coupled receptor 174 [Carcharodon carcharias]|uniref:probable G-protein coupled receptor 174 n=1 Tax=Carcharodon carcharias TaxID=13397 RepID=UPI001B7E010E|nr:probable G-protein coupled receptor 174 [Carcharodon carcharias]XP_041052358.1 probable G-protein coupled receptor 174 [Carcharodon carcharias]XP_041052359.1 probable G-protein coupled receptor 174 [Carcharodon carcharias]XP_041052360.1 probable G-protein coupled receptor 174 [Carcharodon carcharias]XP_041052361.1 probable G-protein coupled receptor 174 [Carcharodon carcharias]XP_041052363.1 probable G-protein coupled receptor 174 [Carcharodon carcharias]XP_041052364.1 probable G-protein c